MPILMAHRVPGMHLREPRRQTPRASGSRFASSWSARPSPSSTTLTSSRARVAPMTPGRAPSERLLPCGTGKQKEPTPHRAATRDRARTQRPPRARARRARRRRRQQAPEESARRKRATPPRRREPPRRRLPRRPATRPSLARSAEAGLRQAVGCSAGSSPSC